MNETTLTTKEIRARLKAEVKKMAAEQKGRRLAKNEAKAEARKLRDPALIGHTNEYGRSDEWKLNPAWWNAHMRVNNLFWERHGYRDDNRALLLAYAYLKGRTYRQVEAKTRKGHEPDDVGVRFLDGWEGEDTADIHAWVKAEHKTRFEIEAEASSPKATETPVVEVPEPPKATGLLGKLRGALGVGA